jgi:malonate-semialdehyde dehydrogenase (acetylating)/methylmalonate-semialdehyde dehydrogenase
MTRIAHWIGGAETAGTSGRVGPVFNPATGEQIAEVDLASAAEVATAVLRAKEAAALWRSASLSKRSAVLFKFR